MKTRCAKTKLYGFIFLACIVLQQSAFAVDGTGTIDKIRICTGNDGGASVAVGWQKLGLFKLSDGKWFGTFINFGGDVIGNTVDDLSIYSTAMMAFTTRNQVFVRAAARSHTVCGITANFLYRDAGDYIEVSQ